MEAQPWGRGATAALHLSPPRFSQGRALRAGPTFPQPWALGSGPRRPLNSFPSERKCFVLFLFVSYPTACWFLVHFSNIYHLPVCACVFVCACVCASLWCVCLSLLPPDGPEGLLCKCCSLTPRPASRPHPQPVHPLPRLLECACGLREPLVPTGVPHENVDSWVIPELCCGKQACRGRESWWRVAQRGQGGAL